MRYAFAIFLLIVLSKAMHDSCTDALSIDIPFFSFSADTHFLNASRFVNQHGDIVTKKGMYFKINGIEANIIASTCDPKTLLDTQIVVFNECKDSVASDIVTANEQFCGTQSLVEFSAESNRTYYIFVSGVNNLEGIFTFLYSIKMEFQLTCELTTTIHPENLPVSVIGKMKADIYDYKSKGNWFHLGSSSESHFLSISTCSKISAIDTKIEIYSSCNATADNLIAEDDDGCGFQSLLLFRTEPNVDYWIFVYSLDEDGPYALTISEIKRNECENPIIVDEFPSAYKFEMEHIKADTKFNLTCNDVTKFLYGVWIRVVGRNANFIISTCKSSNTKQDTSIFVYDSCTMNTCIAYNDNYCGTLSKVTFYGELNKEYSIFIGATDNSILQYDISLGSSGNNNVCHESFQLSFPGYSSSELSKGVSRWFKFIITSENSKSVEIDISKSKNINKPVIEVYSSCDSSKIFYNTHYESKLTFSASAKKLYYIKVYDDTNATDYLSYLQLELLEQDYNESGICIAPVQIKKFPYNGIYETKYQEQTFDGCMQDTSKGVFFTFTGTGDKVTLYTYGTNTNFNTFISIYDSCEVEGNMHCLYNNDNFFNYASSLSFFTEKNKKYLAYVGGVIKDNQDNEGIFSLAAISNRVVPESQCQDAIQIRPFQRIIGQTTSAFYSRGDCQNGYKKGIWYSFEGPGEFFISTCSAITEFDAQVQLYLSCSDNNGTSCSSLDKKTCSQNGNLYYLNAANQTYYLFVTGDGKDNGVFQLLITKKPNDNDKRDETSFLVTIIICAVVCSIAIVLIGYLIHRYLEKTRKTEDKLAYKVLEEDIANGQIQYRE